MNDLKDDLNDFALFAAVVSNGSFSATGRALGIPKSRVSRRIGNLERRLGVRLLQRSTRAMHVTDVGAAFFRHCETMTQAARSALEVAEHAGARPVGRLRVSCPTGVAHIFLAPVLPVFLARHPGVRLELELTNRRVDVIAEGFDLALRIRTAIEDSELVARTFGLSDQVLVASPAFDAEHGPFASAAALDGCAGLGPGGGAGERPVWRLADPHGAPLEIAYAPVFVTDDVHLLQGMALSGRGVAVLPFDLCADAVERGDLRILLPDHRLPPHRLHAVLPTRRGVVPAVRAFIDLLDTELKRTTARTQARFHALGRQGVPAA